MHCGTLLPVRACAFVSSRRFFLFSLFHYVTFVSFHTAGHHEKHNKWKRDKKWTLHMNKSWLILCNTALSTTVAYRRILFPPRFSRTIDMFFCWNVRQMTAKWSEFTCNKRAYSQERCSFRIERTWHTIEFQLNRVVTVGTTKRSSCIAFWQNGRIAYAHRCSWIDNNV